MQPAHRHGTVFKEEQTGTKKQWFTVPMLLEAASLATFANFNMEPERDDLGDLGDPLPSSAIRTAPEQTVMRAPCLKVIHSALLLCH